jgi:glycosyltransferase involved in cell wall biosynthesis
MYTELFDRTASSADCGPLRVLVVHNRYQIRGGEDIAVDGEIAALRGAGVDVGTVIVSNDCIRSRRDFLGAIVGAARSGYGVGLVREAIQAFRPAIMHVHNYFPLLSPAVHSEAHSAGVATVQTFHNFRAVCAGALLMRNGAPCHKCIGASAYWGAWHRCYRGSLPGSVAAAWTVQTHRQHGTWKREVDRLIAMSPFARDLFAQSGLPAEKVVVKPNSVDDPGPPCEGERQGIVYAGRLSQEKGVRILVAAARQCPAKIEMIGEGPLAAELMAKLPPNVIMRGALPRAETRARIATAQAVVIPSLCYEGSPMVLAEAFAAGTPVIASRLGPLIELVQHGETGLHAKPGDAASLALQVKRIGDDPTAARAYGRKARSVYEAKWSPRANVALLLRVYGEALKSFAESRQRPAVESTK